MGEVGLGFVVGGTKQGGFHFPVLLGWNSLLAPLSLYFCFLIGFRVVNGLLRQGIRLIVVSWSLCFS